MRKQLTQLRWSRLIAARRGAGPTYHKRQLDNDYKAATTTEMFARRVTGDRPV